MLSGLLCFNPGRQNGTSLKFCTGEVTHSLGIHLPGEEKNLAVSRVQAEVAAERFHTYKRQGLMVHGSLWNRAVQAVR